MPVITRVPTIAWAAPPPLTTPREDSVKNSTLRPGMPRLATSKISDSSGIIASPKAAAIAKVTVRSLARRDPSTARDQA